MQDDTMQFEELQDKLSEALVQLQPEQLHESTKGKTPRPQSTATRTESELFDPVTQLKSEMEDIKKAIRLGGPPAVTVVRLLPWFLLDPETHGALPKELDLLLFLPLLSSWVFNSLMRRCPQLQTALCTLWGDTEVTAASFQAWAEDFRQGGEAAQAHPVTVIYRSFRLRTGPQLSADSGLPLEEPLTWIAPLLPEQGYCSHSMRGVPWGEGVHGGGV
uniref:Uncharacterized protein n=1 Tax=Knipowitschia caucasica TaxID=637954 RepID=A0AAV2JF51_KNICA